MMTNLIKRACTCPECDGLAESFVIDVGGEPRTIINCQVCKEKKQKAAEERRMMAQVEQANEIKRKGGIEGPMSDISLESYECQCKRQQEAYAIASAFLSNPQMPWLIMCGKTGTGKTHLALSLANVTAENLLTIYYSKIVNLMQRLRASFRNDSIESEQAIVQQMKRVHLLVLDEFGLREHMTDYERAILDDILDTRWIHRKKTIIISNMTIKEMITTAGERIESRIADCGKIVNFTWSDYRKGK